MIMPQQICCYANLCSIGLSCLQCKESHFCRSSLFSKFVNSFKGLPIICLLAHAAPGDAHVLDLGTFTNLAQRCGSSVATLTLAAIAKTESRFETLVVADNTTHISRTYQSIEQATAVATRLIAKGHSVDLGMMQINSANLKRLGMSVRDALDPCRAIRAAASVVTSNFLTFRRLANEQIALRNAISMYNTGNAVNGYKNGYVRRVETSARSLSTYFNSVIPFRPKRNIRSNHFIDINPIPKWWDVWSHNESTGSVSITSERAAASVYVL